MLDGSNSSVAIHINGILDGVSPTYSKPSILRVDSHLRISASHNDHEPKKLSIGPYHRGVPRLQPMEQQKYKYVKRLLSRRNEQHVDRYVAAVTAMKEEARNCYAQSLDIDGDAFVRLMVLDGLFLIELLRSHFFEDLRCANDPIFMHQTMLNQLRHDILLLENQLPFIVLKELFAMTKSDEIAEDDLIPLFFRFVDGMFLNFSATTVKDKLPAKNFEHLCELTHSAWCIPFAEAINPLNNEVEKWENIKSVTELRETGIELKKAAIDNNLMDIRFLNGELRIPQLSIFDATESQFRNLIVYEQCLPDAAQKYVSDYIFFMHCLVNSSRDVELLRGRGIIENCVGNDDDVCSMFNRLDRNILTSSRFGYAQVFNKMNRHSSRLDKKYKALLCLNYFNSPWSILKLLAAIALLLLAFISTTYTVLTYYKRK